MSCRLYSRRIRARPVRMLAMPLSTGVHVHIVGVCLRLVATTVSLKSLCRQQVPTCLMLAATRSQGLIWKDTLTLFHRTTHLYGDFLPRVSTSRGREANEFSVISTDPRRIGLPYWFAKGQFRREITTWNQRAVHWAKTSAQRRS